ncbi:methionine--tRNA ligase [Candidatus Parcubacteria bacterium]|nr:methionine--tRNA ligase [Candidatus Parcubacteria bacterium]
MNKKPFYITTTLPYANSKPHVGHAVEFARADAVARFKRATGHEVFFNTGTDEHGIKIYQKAQEEGKDVMDFLNEGVEHFKILAEKLNISYDKFIRTTDPEHEKAAQEFWKICDQNGFIYKKQYSGLYCVGCEMFKTEKELINGECPDHSGKKIEEISEENYFFKYSEFADKLKELYETRPDFVIPENRLKEISSFVKEGLNDFSISRLKEKMPWGVEVPGDSEHVMYVWFDALVNYISTLGWPDNKENFEKFWVNGTPVQYCGKDNIQHQSARWQAMLMSVGLPVSNNVIVNGFVLSDGKKMSKSVGNVIDPMDVLNEYGTDALRYYLIRELSPFEDSDFTINSFKESYNANLANGIGNLTSRIMKMAEDHINKVSDEELGFDTDFSKIVGDEYIKYFNVFNLQKVADIVWSYIGEIDQRIQETEPFKLVKEDKEKAQEIIRELVVKLYKTSKMLEPLLPETAEKIQKAIKENKKPSEPIFARIN